MTGLKIWGAFTAVSAVGAIGSGISQVPAAISNDSTVTLYLFLAALVATGTGAWKMAMSVNKLATKEHIKALDQRIRKLEEAQPKEGP